MPVSRVAPQPSWPAAGATILAGFAVLMLGASTLVFDDRLLVWLNQFMLRWHAFDTVTAWLLHAHIVKFGPPVLAICWLWFDKSPEQTHRRRVLVETVSIGLIALFVGRVLALGLPFRVRPAFIADLHLVVPFDIGLRTWSSFPSDHAVITFALAASLWRLSPRLGLWLFVHSIVIVCFPRLYFGMHHPSDLFGGAMIGIGLVIALSQVRQRHAATTAALALESKHPAAFYAVGFVVLYEITEMFDSFRAVALSLFGVLKHSIV